MPVAVALFIMLAGVGLGIAWFAAERHLIVWTPSITPTESGGWVIAGVPGTRTLAPAIAGGRLVWGQNGHTCTLDLASGERHVVGAAPRSLESGAPAASVNNAAWLETPRDDLRRRGQLWLYDAERGRRRSLPVAAEATGVAVDGGAVVWYEGGSQGTILILDVASGLRSTVVRDTDVRPPALAGGGLVGWLRTSGSATETTAVLRDTATGAETRVPLGDGYGVTVGVVELRARTLLWTLESAAGTSVCVQDERGRAAGVLATGDISAAATDGEMVVWSARDAGVGAWIIRGRRLNDGQDLELARLPAAPGHLALGDGWMAWSSGGDSGALTAERIAP